MSNELLLIFNLLFLYTAVLLAYKFLGKTGLFCWTVLATIAANIEVLIVVEAFGMEQTLGNILFATTFLVTDILSETQGKKDANKAVILGICTSAMFILISQSWLLYTPNSSDWASPAIATIFANTPRLMLSSLIVYAIVQAFDVFAYHTIWKKTTALCKDSKRFLWLRNNLSTMTSQLLNAFLASLPQQTRRVFVRRYWYADSIREIAARYQMGESKVKTMLLRARDKLRVYLESEGIHL